MGRIALPRFSRTSILVALTVAATLASACAPPPIPGKDMLALGPIGTWTSDNAIIEGESSFFESPYAGSASSLTVTATVGGKQVAQFSFNATIKAPFGYKRGTYEATIPDGPKSRSLTIINKSHPSVSFIGSLNIEEIELTPGANIWDGAEIAKLEATYTGWFGDDLGLVSGRLSIS